MEQILEKVLEIIAFVNNPALQGNVYIASLRWLFIMVSLFFVTLIIFVALTSPTWKSMSSIAAITEFISFRSYGLRKMGRRWRKVMARLDTQNEAEYKLAIIEADSILGDTLQKMDLDGDTTEQRLEKVTKMMIPSVENVISAHQIRNSIVYDPNYRLSLAEARRVMEIYETAFLGLDLIG